MYLGARPRRAAEASELFWLLRINLSEEDAEPRDGEGGGVESDCSRAPAPLTRP